MRRDGSDRLVVEAGVVAALAVAVAALSVWGYHPFGDFPPLTQHLGAEYYNIARAIADGRGFADPFGESTGPTSWMPPLFPLILAGLILMLGKKASVALAVVILTGVAHVLIGWTLFRMARQIRTRLSPLIAPALYVVWLCLYYYWFFAFTHDIWLSALVVTVVLSLAFRHLQGAGRPVRWWQWGLAGGAATLTSPSIALGWAALSAAAFLRARVDGRRLMLAGAMALALALPWVGRNAVVFGRFIPMKSNLFYDAYQANVVDDDGVYDYTTVAQHPYRSSEARFIYAQLGETAFLDKHRRALGQALRERPLAFVRRAGNRLLAATVLYRPMVRQQWFTLGEMARGMCYPLPFIATVIAIGMRRRGQPWLLAFALFACVYLIPYIVVAFYMRYLMPLAPLFALFMFSASDRIAAARAQVAFTPRGVFLRSF